MKNLRIFTIMIGIIFMVSTFHPVESASDELVMTDMSCSYFDDMGIHVNDYVIVRIIYSPDKISLVCVFSSLNQNNNTIVYDTNENSIRDGIACKYQSNQTFDWSQFVNPNGMTIIQCIFEK